MLASVLVVEDDSFARALMTSSLQAAGLKVVMATGSAAKGLQAVRAHSVDVAILDLDLGPGPTGFELAQVLRREFSRLGIIFLTSYADPRLLGVQKQHIPVGARFIKKGDLDDAQSLVSAVLQVRARPLISQRYEFGAAPLTESQLQLLKLVAKGLTSKEIAAELGVTEKAIEASINRVHKLLELQPSLGGGKRVSLVKALYAITGRTPPRD